MNILFVVLLVFMFFFRFEMIYHPGNILLSNLGMGVSRFIVAMFFLSGCSIWLSEIDVKNKYLMKKLFIVIVAINSLLIFTVYNVSLIVSDNILLMIFSIYLAVMIVNGDYIFSNMSNIRRFDDGEIEKAFLTYPPKNYFDFLYFYIFIGLFMLMPLIVEKYWE